jgi:uncharacterized protein YkwD
MKSRRAALAVLVFAVSCGPQDADIGFNEYVDDSAAETVDEFDTIDQALNAGMLDAEEAAFLSVINEYRASLGLTRLKVSIALTRAADFHSKDMATTGKLQHSSSDGTSFSDRVKRWYPCNCWLGENIAVGYGTASTVFTAWKNSPGHDANMKGANYKVIGISRLPNADGRYYWTTDFGSDVDAILSAGTGSIASNGGFEADAITAGVSFGNVRTLNRWHTNKSTGGSAARTTAAALSGGWGLRLGDPDPGSVSGTQVVRAAANVNYRVSATARRSAGTTQQTLYLDFLDGSFTRLKAVTVGASTAPLKVEEVSPAGTKYVRVILWGSGTAGHKSTWDWDAVRVEAW